MKQAAPVALLTGGGGIGGAVARRMAVAGMIVVIADYDHAAAEQVSAEIKSGGGKAEALSVDVTQAREVKALVTDVAQRFGCIDIPATIRRNASGRVKVNRYDGTLQRLLDYRQRRSWAALYALLGNARNGPERRP